MTWDGISANMTKDATMTSAHISATATYVLWSEEHLWNISVLKKVHLLNLVSLCRKVTEAPPLPPT
jgi:hypothetical protein